MNTHLTGREVQRKEFFEILRRKFLDFEKEFGQEKSEIKHQLVQKCICWLENDGESYTTNNYNLFVLSNSFFSETILPDIKVFSISEEEKFVLLAHFLEWLVSAITAELKENLFKKERFSLDTITA